MTLPEGTFLKDRYRIDQMLAQGGMGAIYQGFDTVLELTVAIKENFFQTSSAVRQFEQEAKILARLKHPGLPRVSDHFTVDGLQYLVMDFIEGQDLWDTIDQNGPLDEAKALTYMIQICDAVSYLHQQSPPIIHRDIKPQNVRITSGGQPVLVDFGIAKLAEEDTQTMTGAKGITPGFSPPEQYTGQGTNHASDTYSLGATLYALITGEKPPDSVSLMTGRKQFEAPHITFPNLNQGVSAAIQHAMQVERTERPQSVSEWQQELEACLKTISESIWLIDSEGQSYQLKPGTIIMGRAVDCDIVVSDALASRQHAMLEFDGQHCMIYDEGSANGTFINDERVDNEGRALKFGDTLRIGQSIFALSNTTPAEQSTTLSRNVDNQAETAYLESADDIVTAAGVTRHTPADRATVVSAQEGTVKPTRITPSKQQKQKMLPLVVIGVVVVVALLIIGAGIAFFASNGGPESAEQVVAAATVSTSEQKVKKTASTPTPAGNTNLDTEATATAAWLDGDDDRDGLTNRAEIELGTLPDDRDTDRDDVDDADEINLHQTNPLNDDTDGDGLKDGLEISQGLNPLNGDTDGDGLFDASDPDPGQAPTPTPPPTFTPTPTPTPPSKPTATPTAAEAPAEPSKPIAQAAVSAAPPGVFQDFENQTTWKRGDQTNGEFFRSSAQAHSGNFAGQLDYDFPSPGANDFVVFLQNRPLSGTPNAISAWVYGDGAGHFINAWIKDAAGQTWGMSFGQITHTGWQQMSAFLDPNQPWPSGHIGGPDNGVIDYPITFEALALDDGVDTFSGQGTIYIDDLASVVGASAPAQPTTAPATGTDIVIAADDRPPTLAVSNSDYALEVGQEFSYAQPWGAPRTGDVCDALLYEDWDDSQDIYRGLNIELILTNNTQTAVPDDWGGLEYQTGFGERGTFCHFAYPGSGPPPGESRSVTFFALVPIGDYVQYIRLNNVSGQPLELCLTRDETIC